MIAVLFVGIALTAPVWVMSENPHFQHCYMTVIMSGASADTVNTLVADCIEKMTQQDFFAEGTELLTIQNLIKLKNYDSELPILYVNDEPTEFVSILPEYLFTKDTTDFSFIDSDDIQNNILKTLSSFQGDGEVAGGEGWLATNSSSPSFPNPDVVTEVSVSPIPPVNSSDAVEQDNVTESTWVMGDTTTPGQTNDSWTNGQTDNTTSSFFVEQGIRVVEKIRESFDSVFFSNSETLPLGNGSESEENAEEESSGFFGDGEWDLWESSGTMSDSVANSTEFFNVTDDFSGDHSSPDSLLDEELLGQEIPNWNESFVTDFPDQEIPNSTNSFPVAHPKTPHWWLEWARNADIAAVINVVCIVIFVFLFLCVHYFITG